MKTETNNANNSRPYQHLYEDQLHTSRVDAYDVVVAAYRAGQEPTEVEIERLLGLTKKLLAGLLPVAPATLDPERNPAMKTTDLVAQILNAQADAARLLAAQRDYAATEARILARVDAEIAKRAEQDRAERNAK